MTEAPRQRTDQYDKDATEIVIKRAARQVKDNCGAAKGDDGKATGPGPRHARLVVGAAATLAYYWFETDKEQP